MRSATLAEWHSASKIKLDLRVMLFNARNTHNTRKLHQRNRRRRCRRLLIQSLQEEGMGMCVKTSALQLL